MLVFFTPTWFRPNAGSPPSHLPLSLIDSLALIALKSSQRDPNETRNIYSSALCRSWSWPPTTIRPYLNTGPWYPSDPAKLQPDARRPFQGAPAAGKRGAGPRASSPPTPASTIRAAAPPAPTPPLAGARHPPRHPARRFAPRGILRRLRGRLRRPTPRRSAGSPSTRRSAGPWPEKNFSAATATSCATSTPWKTSSPSCRGRWAATAIKIVPILFGTPGKKGLPAMAEAIAPYIDEKHPGGGLQRPDPLRRELFLYPVHRDLRDNLTKLDRGFIDRDPAPRFRPLLRLSRKNGHHRLRLRPHRRHCCACSKTGNALPTWPTTTSRET